MGNDLIEKEWRDGKVRTATFLLTLREPKERVKDLQEELAKTPKWRWLKRRELKANIEFWSDPRLK